MLGRIEIRLGVPEDFKIKKGNRTKLREGAIFFVVNEEMELKMDGCFVLTHDHDLYIFKKMLESEKIYVPVGNEKLADFLKDKK